MTPNDALKFADTFNKPFDNPDDRVIALATLAAEVRRITPLPVEPEAHLQSTEAQPAVG